MISWEEVQGAARTHLLGSPGHLSLPLGHLVS